MFVKSLHAQFVLKNLGPLHFFLSFEVTRHTSGLHLCQAKYMQSLLTKANVFDANPIASPMQSEKVISRQDDSLLDNTKAHLYKSMVRVLQYHVVT